MTERIAPIAVMMALVAIVIGCATTYHPGGTIETAPADGVIEALQVAITEAGAVLERAQTERERDELSARLARLREELQRWREWVR